MNCKSCYNPIETERLMIIPNTVVCASCAQKYDFVKPRLGRMVFGHKTGAEIQIMSQQSFKETKMYYEPIGSRSAVKNFSKNVCA